MTLSLLTIVQFGKTTELFPSCLLISDIKSWHNQETLPRLIIFFSFLKHFNLTETKKFQLFFFTLFQMVSTLFQIISTLFQLYFKWVHLCFSWFQICFNLNVFEIFSLCLIMWFHLYKFSF